MVCYKRIILWFLSFFAIYLLINELSLMEYFLPRDPILHELKSQLSIIHPRFQHVELYEGKKSYTINKKKVYICLKDKNGRYYNRNMLCYVILHEYAHMLCDEIGHTDKFYDVFDDLLKKAGQLGLYDPDIPPLRKYCGHE